MCREPRSDHRVTHKVLCESLCQATFKDDTSGGKNVFEIKEEIGLFDTKVEIPHLFTVYSDFYLYMVLP